MIRGLALALLLSLPASAVAQPSRPSADPVSRGLDLERRGQHDAAVELYRSVLAAQPAEISALLGLERSLGQSGKIAEMVPEVRRAVQSSQPSIPLYGLAVRVYMIASQPDSARAVVERWAVLEPASEAPFQEWGSAALGARDRGTAKEAYALGRRTLGGSALAGEIAQLATIERDFATAAREWVAAVTAVPAYRSAAVSMLGQMATATQPEVLESLAAHGAEGTRIASLLMIRWGDPLGGVRRIASSPELGGRVTEAMQDALGEVRGLSGRDAFMAKATALEFIGGKDPMQANRAWMEAAQAYADAGDREGARRLLARIASEGKGSPGTAASATATLVSVLISEGKMEEAAEQLGQLSASLKEEDRQALTLRLAEGWIRAGKLDAAATAVAQDSTVEGLAMQGWIKLYQGDIRGGSELLRFAGPFAGAREAAVSRTAVLALLQVIDGDSMPALGQALLGLERRDSVAAAGQLEKLGGDLPPERGGAELLLLAGRIQAGVGDAESAMRLLGRVAGLEIPASAAAAGLDLARIQIAQDRKPEAIATLETVLLSYPTSAVAPQARRMLDQAKGAIPPG
ncbi:MAG: tetratricopeptide repeat protein [Gemmatimonadales bacterium]